MDEKIVLYNEAEMRIWVEKNLTTEKKEDTENR
jgi:hypothetical protein